LQHAERLIRTTDLPVTDVCFQSGFNRLDYFSTAFAKRYNVPPSKYK
jgi:AraC family transcriptional regulator